MVDKSAAADLGATKMLIDMLKEAEAKAGAASPEPAKLTAPDREVVALFVARLRRQIAAEAVAPAAEERGGQEILRTGKFVVPAKAGTQEQTTEIPGFPLSRERPAPAVRQERLTHGRFLTAGSYAEIAAHGTPNPQNEARHIGF
jgi:hypothetical protein